MSKYKSKIGRTWIQINTRCNNRNDKNYLKYGARGIKCLWKSFEEFRRDMEPSMAAHIKKHGGGRNTSIERIDNNGPYSKENCRWATVKEQARNRRSRVEIIYKGEKKSVTEWAEMLGIPKIALWLRLFRYKWPVEEAFTRHIRDGITPCNYHTPEILAAYRGQKHG